MQVFYRLLQLLCLWAIVCTYSSDGQSECTSGFMSRDRVRDLSRVVGGNLRTRQRQQRIIPMINFTCYGSINKWTVAAEWNGRGMEVNSPQLEIWRIRSAGSNVYDRVGNTPTQGAVENTSEIYEFVPSPPLQFQPGDILGIFNPDNPRLAIYYVDKIGPPNYRTSAGTSPSTDPFTVSANTDSQNDMPLITVDTSTSNGSSDCTNGFTSLDVIVAALNEVVNRDRQQRIIPHINFTCDGVITKWIVAGRWDDGGMHDWYPDLQIWRSTGTNMFTKVGNTTLRVESGSDIVSYYEYSLTTPLNFQAGDVLGIFQPDKGKNRLRMYFQSGVGPRNYYKTLANRDLVEPPSDIFALGTVFQNDLPLVAVGITVATAAPTSTTTTSASGTTTTEAGTTTTEAGTTTTEAGTTTTEAGTTTTVAGTTTTVAGTTTTIMGNTTAADSTAKNNSTSSTSTDATTTITSEDDLPYAAGHTSVSPLSTAATIGIAVSGTVIFVVVLLIVVAFLLARKIFHSKEAVGNLYGTPDAISMKKNEAYGANTQTQHIATAINEAYDCRGDIPVVAYTPAAVNFPTVQNEAYGSGAAVNTDTEENIPVVINMAYTPAAVNIPTAQNNIYCSVSGAAVNTDTEEHIYVDVMYEYEN